MDPSLKSRFVVLYSMVLADGIVEAAELETLHRIGKECYGLTPEEIASFCVGATPLILPEQIEEKIDFLYQLAQIAVCDGRVDDSERKLLERYALKMSFVSENIPQIIEFLLEKAENDIPSKQVISEILNS
ncbi:MAG: TerB family tellurite resistance protein [Bacteroides sp.]|nr:TerB family tellurite resistance protein [Bacteroides sp.]MCM1458234.1 TerB family tellurite resistance protein [Lachnoclostridium sp.]